MGGLHGKASFYAVVGLLCLSSLAGADTHWANINGSNTPPYTSYATGAHEIQDAINVAVAGDTIRIAAGLYRPDTTTFLKDSIAIIGAGTDSTVVYPTNEDFNNIFEIAGPSGSPGGGIIFKGCKIRGAYNKDVPNQYGIGIFGKISTTNIISHNSFYYCRSAVELSNANAIVADNYFDSNETAIDLSFHGPFDIHDNTVIGTPIGGGYPPARAIDCFGYVRGPTRIYNNTFFTRRGTLVDVTSLEDSISIYNNTLIIGESYGLYVRCDCAGTVIRNNTIIRNDVDPYGFYLAMLAVEEGSEMIIENNIFQGLNGVVQLVHASTTGGTWRFAYNDIWGLAGTGISCMDDSDLDSIGNLFQNPMCTTDSTYVLQRGSPLIDAGNPALSDKDGTRSDIGWAGGPGGISYAYPEEPPQRPDTLIAEPGGDTLRLSWPPNSEADLGGYCIYRDSFSGFSPDPSHMLASLSISDTSYADCIASASGELYYVVTAVDTTGLASPPSNEVFVMGTGIFEESDQQIAVPRTPGIIATYPNPFNASTTIEYVIPEIGTLPLQVQLRIFDILGRKAATVVGERQYPGQHRATWDGCTDAGVPAGSGVYFAKLTLWGYEFSSSAKLVLQK